MANLSDLARAHHRFATPVLPLASLFVIFINNCYKLCITMYVFCRKYNVSQIALHVFLLTNIISDKNGQGY